MICFFLSLFFSGLSEGDLLSGVMFIHSSRTLGVSEVLSFNYWRILLVSIAEVVKQMSD